jgi:hypothetical protein
MSNPYTKEKEQFERSLGSISLCLNICPTESDGTPEWFVSFGSLLGVVRDRGKLLGDLDISMFYEEDVAERMIANLIQFNWQERGRIIHPSTKKPLHLSFVPVDKRMNGGMVLDLFFWLKVGDIYYHTYDYKMENPKNGIPSEYYFKGCHKRILRGATWQYVWPGTANMIRLPHYYGTLLDYWYPGWYRKDSMFGQSKAKQVVKVKHPDQLGDYKIAHKQIEASTEEYDSFVKGYIRE